MVVNCPKCNAENRTDAAFCDSCGGSLNAQGDAQSVSNENGDGSQRKVNIGGLIVVVLIIAVAWWFLFGDNSKPGTPPAATGGGSASTANPHGGMDAGAASGAPDDGMNQMMEGIADAKTSLDSNPLDTEALMTLYGTFGTIGRQEQIRPRLDAAVAALVEQAGSMEPDVLSSTLGEIAYAAFNGNDLEGVEHALGALGDAAADNLGIMVLRGDMYFDIVQRFDIDRREDSIAAYTSYLLEVDKDTAGETYWNARTDRATMLLQVGSIGSDDMKLQESLNEFKEITNEKPDFFNAWFNLGLAHSIIGDTAAAEKAFEACVFLSSNEMEGYQVALKLAELRGEDPPAPPASLAPPSMGGGDGGGMANPHGGGGMGAGDTGGGDTEGGMANPHGGS